MHASHPTILLPQVFDGFDWERADDAILVVVAAAAVYLIGRILLRRLGEPKYPSTDRVRSRAETARSVLLSAWKYVVALGTVAALLAMASATLGRAVAITGIVGAVLALTATTLFRDVIAGFSILLEGQYAAGDRVRLFGVDIEGTVEAIGLRITVIREDSGSRVFVPNGAITAVRAISGDASARASRPDADRPRRPARRGGSPARTRRTPPASAAAEQQADDRTAPDAAEPDAGRPAERTRTTRGGRRRGTTRRRTTTRRAPGEEPAPTTGRARGEEPAPTTRRAPAEEAPPAPPEEQRRERAPDELGESPWSIE